MLGSIPASLAVLAGGPHLLVLPGALGAGVAFSRASNALALGADGSSWGEVAVGAPRFHGTARRFLVEGARSNLVRNARAEGATAGPIASGGVFPTFWSGTNATGFTLEIVGTGTEGGLPFLDLKVTTAGAFNRTFDLEAASGIPLTPGVTYSVAIHARLLSGSLAGYTALGVRRRTDTAAAANGTSASFLGVTGAPLATQRFAAAQAVAADAATARMQCALIGTATGEVVLRLAAPTVEAGPFASAPMLPTPGSPAAAARAADAPTLSLAGVTAGTLVMRAMIPQAAPAGLDQGLLQLDDGTDANRILLRNTAGGAAIAALVVSGGTMLATLAGGSMAAGTPFRAVLAWSPTGTALCVTGGTVQTTTFARPAAVNRLLIGHAAAALNRALHGEVERLELHPARLPDATLLALASS
jgi:hypothetical protein